MLPEKAEKMNEKTPPSCGFAAILGAPNAGKSTLVNALVGTKVSIVSPKVQTTRTRVLGIAIHENTQIMFVDTPGIFKPRDGIRLERAIVASAWDGLAGADVVLLVVDALAPSMRETAMIIERLKQGGNPPCLLILNKVDKARPEKFLPLAAELNTRMDFAATFMVSALTGDGVADVLAHVSKRMPQGPWHYPEDQVSDMPARLLAAEITREKLFHALHQELPYALTVETETWEAFDNGDIRIGQAIIIARESQKKIVLGHRGSMIKSVGESARKELEDILETRVHLSLFVKVRERWMESAEHYNLWNLNRDA